MNDRHTVNTITSDALDQLYDQRDETLAAVERVRALHENDGGICSACTAAIAVLYPCPTITALDQPTPAATRADTCGHTVPGVFGRPLGPCHRRPGHPELFHQDATGAEWRPTRTAGNEEQPTPAATFDAAEYEDIKTRWSKTYGKPGTAHPVTEVHPTSEEQSRA